VNTRTISGRLRGAAALALLPLLTLTACGSGDTGGTAAVGAQASPVPTDDPVAAVRKVDSAAALLPADVREAGKLKVGSSIGFPPGAYYPNGTDKAPAGQDIDLADARTPPSRRSCPPWAAASTTSAPATSASPPSA